MRIVIEIEHENDNFQVDGLVHFPAIGQAVGQVGSHISQRMVEGSLNDMNGNLAIRFWVSEI